MPGRLTTRACAYCAADFDTRDSRQRFCSKTCGAQHRRMLEAPSTSELPWAPRGNWHSWFVARKGRRHHTQTCTYRIRSATVGSSSPCRTCSTPIPYPGMGRPRRYCSKACAPVWLRDTTQGRAARRRAKAKRRARKANAHAERFDPQEVFVRDHWTCHLCHRPTKRTALVPHPDAPTLDHIVPLAEGGDHTRANTACAHFLCNSRKGAGAVGEQLRLVG